MPTDMIGSTLLRSSRPSTRHNTAGSFVALLHFLTLSPEHLHPFCKQLSWRVGEVAYKAVRLWRTDPPTADHHDSTLQKLADSHTEATDNVPQSLARRQLITAAAGLAAVGLLGAPSIVRAQSTPKIRIGFWPVASALPFFVAIEKGYFKEADLEVEALKFASAQQVMDAMLSGRAEGSSNGTASVVLAIGEIAQPGLFKIFCTNPTNAKYVLDEFIVAKDSPIKTLAELKGKRVACGPGIQNVTLAKVMLERAGAGTVSYCHPRFANSS